jgi:hypothetical protein
MPNPSIETLSFSAVVFLGAVANLIPTLTARSRAVSKRGTRIELLDSERILFAATMRRLASRSDGIVARPIESAANKPDCDLEAIAMILAGVTRMDIRPKAKIASEKGIADNKAFSSPWSPTEPKSTTWEKIPPRGNPGKSKSVLPEDAPVKTTA